MRYLVKIGLPEKTIISIQENIHNVIPHLKSKQHWDKTLILLNPSWNCKEPQQLLTEKLKRVKSRVICFKKLRQNERVWKIRAVKFGFGQLLTNTRESRIVNLFKAL